MSLGRTEPYPIQVPENVLAAWSCKSGKITRETKMSVSTYSTSQLLLTEGRSGEFRIESIESIESSPVRREYEEIDLNIFGRPRID